MAHGQSPPAIGRDAALFLDFDGTIADLAPRPDGVHLDPGTVEALGVIAAALGGAVAIVSGRPIREIDAYLAPLSLPVAGVHGFERRSVTGRNHSAAPANEDTKAAVIEAIEAFAGGDARLIVEVKPASVTLHYRQAPEVEADCLALAEGLTERFDTVSLLHGKCVIEAKLSGATKGTAIREFMDEAPFSGRRAVFVGDDVTDEEGFAAVQGMGGLGVKVGDGESAARSRLNGPAEVRAWLADAARRLAVDRTRASRKESR